MTTRDWGISAYLGGGQLYGYHRLNWFHGFSRIPAQKYRQCLVLGSGNGEDVRPIADRVEHFYVVEPARPWWRDEIGGTPATYVEPAVSGAIALPENSCDLIVVLDVLHHIPNVSAVLRELGRVAKLGGWLVMREPITSMGDWRRPRPGLTKHERGIPEAILRRLVAENGYLAEYWKPVMTPFTPRLAKLFRVGPYYNHIGFVYFDLLLSLLLGWNRGRYHRQSVLSKFAPGSVFLVARKS